MASLRKLVRVVCTALAVVLVAGCGATMTPKSVMDARAAYEKAQGGPAAQLTPDQLHEAKLSLDTAEQQFQNDGDSPKTDDLAYIAQRRSELADTQGRIAAATRDSQQAQAELGKVQSQQLQATQGELSKTKQQLAQTGQQLQMTGQQLADEKKARELAEKRARDAMDKLAVAAALAVKDEPRGTVITIPGAVLFTSNQATLLPAAQEKLNQVAIALKNQEDHKMVVEGHTDSQGTESSNQDLSQRRAQSVRDYLVSRGVPSDKISAVGLGQGRPVADNKSTEGRAQNRRVEIIVQPIEKR